MKNIQELPNDWTYTIQNNKTTFRVHNAPISILQYCLAHYLYFQSSPNQTGYIIVIQAPDGAQKITMNICKDSYLAIVEQTALKYQSMFELSSELIINETS